MALSRSATTGLDPPAGFLPLAKRIGRIERRRDRTWIDEVYGSQAGQDGSLAILDGDNLLRDRGRRCLSFSSIAGVPEPLTTVPDALGSMPEPAYDGSHAILCGEQRAVCYGRDGRSV